MLPPSWGGWDWLREQGKTKSEFKIALGCLPCPTAVQPIPYMRKGKKKRKGQAQSLAGNMNLGNRKLMSATWCPSDTLGLQSPSSTRCQPTWALLAGKAPNRPNWRKQANREQFSLEEFRTVELRVIDLKSSSPPFKGLILL